MTVQLAHDVQVYLRQTSTPASRLGKVAVNDPSLVSQLRAGMPCGPRREAKVRGCMAQYPKGVPASAGPPPRVRAVKSRGRNDVGGSIERFNGKPTGPAPFVPIAAIAREDAPLARQISLEADRLGRPVAGLLSELVGLGWRCYVEDARESAS